MRKPRYITQSALIAALYAALAYGQNLLLPGTSGFVIQFRAAEALCVLALFSRAAIPGLGLGCLIFNLTMTSALPLDPLVGTVASTVAALLMWLLRRVTVGGFPLPAILMPVLVNGLFIGWELCFFMGGGFWFNCLCVAAGEAAVLLTLGTVLFFALKKRPVLQ